MIDFYKEYGNVFLIQVRKQDYGSEFELIHEITNSGYKDKAFVVEDREYYLVIAYQTFHRRAYDLKDSIHGRHCSKLDTFTSGFFLEFLNYSYDYYNKYLAYEKGD